MVIVILAIMPWVGCVTKAPLRGPVAKPLVQTQPSKQDEAVAHLEGVWENPKPGGHPRQMIFGAGGQLTFQGGLEFYNPGHWDLNADRQELVLTLPQADVDKLQVFQMYLHDGVKAFDPAHKQITYRFDDQTWTLNIGGWMYSKADKAGVQPEAEPVLK